MLIFLRLTLTVERCFNFTVAGVFYERTEAIGVVSNVAANAFAPRGTLEFKELKARYALGAIEHPVDGVDFAAFRSFTVKPIGTRERGIIDANDLGPLPRPRR